MQPDVNSNEKCWFCKKRKANPASAVKIKMNKNRMIYDDTDPYKVPLYSVKVEFIDRSNLEVFVPRCKSCQSTQKIFHSIKHVPRPIKLFFNFLISAFILGLFIVNLFAFFGMVFIALIIGGIYLLVEKKTKGKLVPGFIERRMESYAYQHPEVRRLGTRSWMVIWPAPEIKQKKK